MRVLVTGGAGYIGSHVLRALLEAGHEPVAYDNLSTGHASAVLDAPLVIADVADTDKLTSVLREYRCSGVIHLAAYSLVGESMRLPSKYFRNNVAGGMRLLDGLVAANVEWLVMSSTAAVYGEPNQVPIPETHPQQPSNPYGESKHMLERMLHWYGQAFGLRSVALRYFNATGAHPSGLIGEDHSPETHLVPIVLQAALGQRPGVDVFGLDYSTNDGTAVRDYVHVCDLAAAHLIATEKLHRGFPGGAFNLGSQLGYSVLDVINACKRITGRDFEVRHASRRPGDPPVLVADTTRARLELGWEPMYSLEGMVETAWHWHSKHPYGYERGGN